MVILKPNNAFLLGSLSLLLCGQALQINKRATPSRNNGLPTEWNEEFRRKFAKVFSDYEGVNAPDSIANNEDIEENDDNQYEAGDDYDQAAAVQDSSDSDGGSDGNEMDYEYPIQSVTGDNRQPAVKGFSSSTLYRQQTGEEPTLRQVYRYYGTPDAQLRQLQEMSRQRQMDTIREFQNNVGGNEWTPLKFINGNNNDYNDDDNNDYDTDEEDSNNNEWSKWKEMPNIQGLIDNLGDSNSLPNNAMWPYQDGMTAPQQSDDMDLGFQPASSPENTYPSPPNPCPKGVKAANCIKGQPDTAVFSKMYQALRNNGDGTSMDADMLNNFFKQM